MAEGFKLTPYERAKIETVLDRCKEEDRSAHFLITQIELLLTQRVIRDQATAIVLAKQDRKP